MRSVPFRITIRQEARPDGTDRLRGVVRLVLAVEHGSRIEDGLTEAPEVPIPPLEAPHGEVTA